jgi:autotransporter-associated beta strand protein
VLNLGLSAASTFDLNGWNQTLTGLTKGASNATVTNNGASPATLTLTPAAAATFAGTFADGTSALNLVKSGAGTLTLSGASTSFTGSLSVTEGGINLTGTLGAAGATASIGAATLSGEGTFGGNLALAGTTVNVDGGTPLGVFVSGNLNTTGGVSVYLQSLPTAAGPIETVSFGGALTGNAGNFTLAGASNYRSPVFSVAANAVNLTLGTPMDLAWTGTGGSNWDINTTSNWNNPSLTPSTFFYADNVTFGNTGGGMIGVPATVTASNLVIHSNDNWLFQGAGTVSASTVTNSSSLSRQCFSNPIPGSE